MSREWIGLQETKIAEVLGSSNVKILTDLLFQSGLNEVFIGLDEFTLFAPSDTAFITALLDLSNKSTFVESSVLRRKLKYHVVPSLILPDALTDELILQTLAGPSVRINIYGSVHTCTSLCPFFSFTHFSTDVECNC